jgi:hypothetical protein
MHIDTSTRPYEAAAGSVRQYRRHLLRRPRTGTPDGKPAKETVANASAFARRRDRGAA